MGGRTIADVVLDASVAKVADSGIIEGTCRMAVVSVVNSGGTIDVTRGDSTFPKVRILSGYLKPAVGDTVEILATAGGWVCVGRVMASSAPRIQSGTVDIPAGTAGSWLTKTVTFPVAFASTPNISLSLNTGTTSSDTFLWAFSSVTTTSFIARSKRSSSTITTYHWIATDF
ncbi:hypothetical protein [Streptomyces sp. 6N106]|uniref:hypothetical protein n=1 Tax=Streptomyces sp. 6N106 TaxID=3457418 RepID=UPI003FD49E30